MSVTWHTLRAGDGHIEVVECYPSLDECLGDMALLAWEDPGNHWLDVVTDDLSGEVVATGMFGPGMNLMVTCSDGRRLVFEMPKSYS